jgi:hypothetical protein
VKTDHLLLLGAAGVAVWWLWPKEEAPAPQKLDPRAVAGVDAAAAVFSPKAEVTGGEVTNMTTSASRVNDLSPAYRTPTQAEIDGSMGLLGGVGAGGDMPTTTPVLGMGTAAYAGATYG